MNGMSDRDISPKKREVLLANRVANYRKDRAHRKEDDVSDHMSDVITSIPSTPKSSLTSPSPTRRERTKATPITPRSIPSPGRSTLKADYEAEKQQLITKYEKQLTEVRKEVQDAWIDLENRKGEYEAETREKYQRLFREKEVQYEQFLEEERERTRELTTSYERRLSERSTLNETTRKEYEAKIDTIVENYDAKLRKKEVEIQEEAKRYEQKIRAVDDKWYEEIKSLRELYEEEIKKREIDYRQARVKEQEERASFDNQVRERYQEKYNQLLVEQEQIIQTIRSDEATIRQRLEEAHARETDNLRRSLMEEQKEGQLSLDRKLEVAKDSFLQDVEEIKRQYSEKVTQLEADKMNYEQSIRAKYEKLVFELQQNLDRQLELRNQQDFSQQQYERLLEEERERTRELTTSYERRLSERSTFNETMRKEYEAKIDTIVENYDAKLRKKEVEIQEEAKKWQDRVLLKEQELNEKLSKAEERMRKEYESLLEKSQANLMREFEIKESQAQSEAKKRAEEAIRDVEMKERVKSERHEEKVNKMYEQKVKAIDDKWKEEIKSLRELYEEEIKKHEDDYRQARVKEQEERALFDQQVRERYQEKYNQLLVEQEQIIQKIRADEATIRQKLEEAHTRELDSLRRSLMEEQKQNQINLDRKLELAKDSFLQDVEEVKKQYAERVTQLEVSKLNYEQTVRAKYDKLVFELQQNLDRQMEVRNQQDDDLRNRMKQERVEFELQLREQYNNMLEEKNSQLEQLLKDRESRLLDDDQKRQLAIIEKEKKMEQERIKSEEQVRVRFEQQVAQLKAAADEQIQEAQDQANKDREQRAEIESQYANLEQQMKKMQHSMDLWKLDYHKSTTQKFKKLMSEVELKAKREMEEFVRKQLEEEELRLAEELRKKDEELKKYKEAEEELQLRAFEQQQQKILMEQKERENAKGKERLEKLKNRLVELWSALETDSSERFKFLWDAESVSPFSLQVMDLFKREIARLTDQLPLMEIITRREFIKQRIRDFLRTSSDSSRLYGNDPGRVIREEKQRQELERELRRLDETLLVELPQYEKKYNVVFSYKGKQYLSGVVAETNQ